MIPVFDANRSKTDAVLTTASLTGTPPHIAPSSEMKRSVSCSLRVSGRRATENNARKGEVINTVIITKNMPLRAVAWIGLRIAGLSWLILSSPENASHAPENPTKNVRHDRLSAWRKCRVRASHSGGPSEISVTPMTTISTTSAAAAMTSDRIALSRIPIILTAARNNLLDSASKSPDI